MASEEQRSTAGILWSGVRGRCPRCGRGHLFDGFLVVWLALVTEVTLAPPLWVHAVLWSPLVLGGSMGLLRPLKGAAVAAQHRFRAVDGTGKPGPGRAGPAASLHALGRGPSKMTAAPIRQMIAPAMSHRSGRWPSTTHSQTREAAM